MTSPFAAAVEGFFRGREWRYTQDERARRREREDVEWEWALEDREWTREERDRLRREGISDGAWTTESRARQRQQWQESDQDRTKKEEEEARAKQLQQEEADLLARAWGIGIDTDPPGSSVGGAAGAPAGVSGGVSGGTVSGGTGTTTTPAGPRLPPRSAPVGIGLPPDPAAPPPLGAAPVTPPVPPAGPPQAAPVQPAQPAQAAPAAPATAPVAPVAPQAAPVAPQAAPVAPQAAPVAPQAAPVAPQAMPQPNVPGILTREPSKPRTPDPWADRLPPQLEPVAGQTPPRPHRVRPNPPATGRPGRVSPQEFGAPPSDALPYVDASAPGRFEAMARRAGATGTILENAQQADMAEAALASGIDPSTGRPFAPGDRQAMTEVLQEVERQLTGIGAAPPPAQPNATGGLAAQAFTEDNRARQIGIMAPDAAPMAPGAVPPPTASPVPPAGFERRGRPDDYPRGARRAGDDLAARPPAQQPAPAQDAAATVAPPQQTPTGTPEASVEAARDAVASVGMNIGVNGVQPTPQQQAKVVERFQKDYSTNRVNDVLRFYLRNGEIEKAKAFREFIGEESTKKAMGHWSKAIMAATFGDEREFINQIAEAYNTQGYYDDGYTIDPRASGFVRDPSGALVPGSARITFVNDATGERFEQVIQGEEDLYRLGISHLSGEEVFERGWEQYLAGRAAQEKNASPPSNRDLLDAIKYLGDPLVNPDAAEYNALSPAERRRLAIELITGVTSSPGVAPADIPVYGER